MTSPDLLQLIGHAVASGGAEAVQAIVADLSEDECADLVYDWYGAWARPCFQRDDGTWGGQTPPPVSWDVWMLLAGRGYGKTRTGAEWVRDEAKKSGGLRFAFVAQDPGDARLVMIYGESGIMAVSPERERPTYNPSLRLLSWPSGSIAEVHSAHSPEALRGPQFHRAWCDELCAWRYARDTWDNLNFGTRLVAPDGSEPKIVITTTPRPTPLLKEIIGDEGTVVTTGSTYDNIANLSSRFIAKVVRRFEGTALGAQELWARLLEEQGGALWSREILESSRVRVAPPFRRVVIGVDPMAVATSRRKTSPPETGIIIAGLGEDGDVYITSDLSITNAKPDVWGRRVIDGYHGARADRVVGEVNNGGDMVEDVIHTRDPTVAFKSVHASKGKRTRAEPVSALYQQGRVHHVGVLGPLEDQLCTWTGADGEASPDRLDALVWAVTDLALGVADASDITYDAGIGRGVNQWRT